MESAEDELVDQIPLHSWHGVNCADSKWHNMDSEFTEELVCFKKTHFDVQGNKLINLAEYMCKTN